MSKNTEQNNDNAKAKAKAAAEEIENEQKRAKAKVPTGESLLERANALTKDASPDAVDDILRDAAKIELSPAWVAKILVAIFERTGTGKTALKDSWKLFQAEHKKAKKKEKKNRARGGTPKNAGDFWFYGIEECIDAINKKCALVTRGEEMRFVFRDKDDKPLFLREKDARVKLGQFLVFDGEEDDPPHQGFRLWLQSPERREYAGVLFNPKIKTVSDDVLNLWIGFAMEPEQGDWSLLKAHMLENMCQGNQTHFEYLMLWIAQMFQEPWRKPGVAVVFRGKMGVGKSKLGDWLAKMVGYRHSLVVEKAEQWTGRFNAQLETVIFLTCEEALFAGSKAAKSTIKHLITSERMAYERKGQDLYEAANFTRVFMASNEDWVVPADSGERRYFVLDVSDAHKEDKPYFAAIDDQMEAGGAEAMMDYLMHLDISTFHTSHAPKTEALAEQIRVGMSPQMKWLESILTQGAVTWTGNDRDRTRERATLCETGVCEIPKDDVLASYREAVPGYRAPASAQDVGIFLSKNVPGIKSGKMTVDGDRAPSYKFPSLADMRAAFLKANPGYAFPDLPEEDTATPEPAKGDTDVAGAAHNDNVTSLDPFRKRSA